MSTADEIAERLRPERWISERTTAMQRAVLLAQTASQRRTPVRTGTLRRSETSRVAAGGVAGYVGTNVQYAPFVHKRVPFFTQGIDDAREQIVTVFADAGLRFFDAVDS